MLTMQRNICFVCDSSCYKTSDFTDSSVYILKSVFNQQHAVPNSTEAGKLSVSVAALHIQEYSIVTGNDQEDSNNEDNTSGKITECRKSQWKSLTSTDNSADSIDFCSFTNPDDMALSLHNLADTLPQGVISVTDVFWFIASQCECNVRLISSLKRLKLWSNTHITIITQQDQVLSNDMELIMNFLKADVCSLSDINRERLFPVWRGSIQLTGSQNKLKLEGFRLDPLLPYEDIDLILDLAKDIRQNQDVCRSWASTLHLLSFTDLCEIPHFYLTGDLYRLSVSNSRVVKTQTFLQKLISVKNSCYILRVYQSSPQSVRKEEKMGSARWHQFVLHNLESRPEENENYQDLMCNAKYSNLVVFAVPTSSNSSSCINSWLEDWTFVACRLCNPSEVSGILVSDVIKSLIDHRANKRSALADKSNTIIDMPLLSSDVFNSFQLSQCREEVRMIRRGLESQFNAKGEVKDGSVGSNSMLNEWTKQTVTRLLDSCTEKESYDEPLIQNFKHSSERSQNIQTSGISAERSLLALRSGCKTNKNHTGLSPPATSKIPVIYDAAEILRHFKSNELSAVEVLDTVPIKASNRLRHYDSMDSRFSSWPDSAQLSCHGIFYCVGAASEEMEGTYERARSRLGSSETASTTGSSESSLDLSVSSKRSGVNRLKRTRSMIEESMDEVEVENRENGGESRQEITRQKRNKTMTYDSRMMDANESRRSSEENVRERSRTITTSSRSAQPTEVNDLGPLPPCAPNIVSTVAKSKSEIRKEALTAAVCEVLEEHDVSISNDLFSSCAKRLANILKAFIKDIAMNLNLKDEIKKLAQFHVNQVIDFEKHLRDKK